MRIGFWLEKWNDENWTKCIHMVNLRMEQPMSMKQVSTVHIWYLEGVCAVKTGGTSCHGEITILPPLWK